MVVEEEKGIFHKQLLPGHLLFIVSGVRAALVVSVGEVLSGGVELPVVLIGHVLLRKRVTYEYAPMTQHKISIGK